MPTTSHDSIDIRNDLIGLGRDDEGHHIFVQHGYPVIDSGSAPGSFYIHFVQWLRNKTGVMTYRIIHNK